MVLLKNGAKTISQKGPLNVHPKQKKVQKLVSNVFSPPISIIDPQFQDHPQLWRLYENSKTRNETKLGDGI
jgi:hypothetical protein